MIIKYPSFFKKIIDIFSLLRKFCRNEKIRQKFYFVIYCHSSFLLGKIFFNYNLKTVFALLTFLNILCIRNMNIKRE